MIDFDDIKLENYDGEDISDVLAKLEKSFAMVIGCVLSLVAFFFDWKIAVAGIVLFACAFRLADWLGKDLELQTVRQLVEKVAREHYVDIRRTKNTVNRNEILNTIKDAFSDNLGIDKAHLTREASIA